MIKLNVTKARQAIHLSDFQEFLLKEMKLKIEDLLKLRSCGDCWQNLKFTERSIEKINAWLETRSPAQKMVKTFRFETKKEAVLHLETLENESPVFISY